MSSLNLTAGDMYFGCATCFRAPHRITVIACASAFLRSGFRANTAY